MTPDMIRQLPAGHALVVRGGYAPGHRPARRRLERPRLQGRPPTRHSRRRSARQRPRARSPRPRTSPRPNRPAGHRRPRPEHGRPRDPAERRRLRARTRGADAMTGTEGLTAACSSLLASREARRSRQPPGRRRRRRSVTEIAALTTLVGERMKDTLDQPGRDPGRPERPGRAASPPSPPGSSRARTPTSRSATSRLPSPRFWKLDGAGPRRRHREAAGLGRAGLPARLRPPGRGLGDCWEQHPLCLYVLDWLSELWSVLYLQPRPHRRNAGRPGRVAHPAACASVQPPAQQLCPARPGGVTTSSIRRARRAVGPRSGP